MQRTVLGARAAFGLVAAAVLLVSAGCTSDSRPSPSPTSSPSASASPTPSASAAPELDPDGTADDNLPYFDSVNSALLAAGARPGGRAIIDALVAAGFDKASMQVTPDTTPTGSAVDSVQFSVRIGDRCLVGQSSGAGYIGTVGPTADGANCLIGITRAIDW